jgi:hypothetical protein
MHQEGYYQPDSCIPGMTYYIKDNQSGALNRFKRVMFVDYCPHPAEVLVRDGSKTKTIHRIYLFQKNGKE